MLSFLWEALSRNGCNSLHNGAVFPCAVGEFDVTFNGGAAQAQTHDFRSSYLLNASGRDCYTQTSADETHDREPLWGLLHNVRAKAVFFAE